MQAYDGLRHCRFPWKATPAIALLAVGIAAPTHAAGPDCAKIDDGSLRLACYDAEFRASISSAQASAWMVREETSKVSDRRSVILAVESLEPLSGRFGRKEKATLILACREGATHAYVIFGGHFMSSHQHGAVTYRVDKKPAVKKNFINSNDHTALGLWSSGNALPFIRELMAGERLYVQATPLSENPVDAEFPIAGLPEAIKPLQDACKVAITAPSKPRGPAP